MSRQDELLMRYHDGDLDPEELREAEQLLAGSAEARALLQNFDVVGGVLRSLADDGSARADDIAGRVLAVIDAEKVAPPAPKRGRLVALYPAAGVLLAAAAVVAVLVRPHTKVPVAELAVHAPVPAAVSAVAPSPEASEVAAAPEPESGASIESIDFGGRNGTIFMVATGPQVTPVVWLMDDGTPDGDRMTPL